MSSLRILILILCVLAEQTVQTNLNQSFLVGVRPFGPLATCSLNTFQGMNELDLNDYNLNKTFQGYEIELLMLFTFQLLNNLLNNIKSLKIGTL